MIMLLKSSIDSGDFKKLGKMTSSSGDALLLYELSEREPGGRFTARCHIFRDCKALIIEGTSRVLRAKNLHSASFSCGNLVDGLPRDYHSRSRKF